LGCGGRDAGNSPSIVEEARARPFPSRDIGAHRLDLNQKPFELIFAGLWALVSAKNPAIWAVDVC
jgi:hypothetical protein